MKGIADRVGADMVMVRLETGYAVLLPEPSAVIRSGETIEGSFDRAGTDTAFTRPGGRAFRARIILTGVSEGRARTELGGFR